MSERTGPFIGIALALALIAYVGFSGGLVDFFFPPQEPYTLTSSSPIEGDPAAVSPFESAESLKRLSHPLCAGTVSQGMTSATMSAPRCVMAQVTR